ncbi:MAG: hypothetical protein P8Y53_03585 [Pseudolabrys sp.]
MSTTPSFQPYGEAPPPADQLTRIADIDPRLTRTNYFDGRLLTAEDLNRDQIYLDGRLREMGRTVGDGIVRGLHVSLDTTHATISVVPGLAINAAGRVLELERTLSVSLSDRAAIGALNDGRYRHLRRGLYAIVLSYAEVGTGVAEVFPTDLGARRSTSYDTISEGVELGLVALSEPLAQARATTVRAGLARSLIGRPNGTLPEECVTLGVLAVSDDRPQWIDAELLRHPPRVLGADGPSAIALTQDLARHYEALLRDVQLERQAAGLTNEFAASEYFQLLPPAGTAPKDAIDPQNARQSFFPDSYDVSIAPVRADDLPALRAEAMHLPPFDLKADTRGEVVILAPLGAADYGQYVPQLEGLVTTRDLQFPALQLLQLRLHPTASTTAVDPRAATVQALWAALAGPPVYLRRAPRAAETGVSAVVLARGFELPPVAPPTETSGGTGTGSSGGTTSGSTATGTAAGNTTATEAATGTTASDIVFNERTAVLKRINLKLLASLRPPPAAADVEAYKHLTDKFGQDEAAVLDIMALLVRIERFYDTLIWPSLALWADKSLLATVRKFLQEKQTPDAKTGLTIVKGGAELGLSGALADRWKKLAEAGP